MVIFNTKVVHASWLAILEEALQALAPTYIKQLQQTANWLPGAAQIFNAFSHPLENTHYILFGESPYPRAQSAIGYASWQRRLRHPD